MMKNKKNFPKLIAFTLVYSIFVSIILISFVWLGVNIRTHGFSIKLYHMHSLDLELYLYFLLFSLLAISILLISVILPSSKKFKKYGNLLGWIFMILGISAIAYILSIAELV